MSTRRKDPIPFLIFDRDKIARRTGKYPTGKTVRPICSECNKAVSASRIDSGYTKAEKKRGRPSKIELSKSRVEIIGYWCKTDRLFFYLDGSADYRERPLQERDQSES